MSKKTVNTAELASVVTPTGVSVTVNVGYHHRVVLTQDGKERELSGQHGTAQYHNNLNFLSEQEFLNWVKANPLLGEMATVALEAKKSELAI